MSANRIRNRPQLEENRKHLRKNLTPAEARLWSSLKGRQLDGKRFRRQFSIGSYILDFYCPETLLAIELDGEVHNDVVQQQYDQERTAYLNEEGIKVIRFENRLVFEQIEFVLESIRVALENPSVTS